MHTPLDTPSGRIVAAAQATTEVTDPLGRRLSVRRLGALDRLRVFKAAGAVLATNPGWMGLATLAFSVTAIDDVPVPAPASEPQVEALVARLGDAGLAAVSATLAAAAVATQADAKN
jgi:hypothetical protein